MSELAHASPSSEKLISELRQLIAAARRHAATTVNAALTLLYWSVGERIRGNLLGNERAGYGQQIVATVSQELVGEYGRGFEVTNLTRMIKFAGHFRTKPLLRRCRNN